MTGINEETGFFHDAQKRMVQAPGLHRCTNGASMKRRTGFIAAFSRRRFVQNGRLPAPVWLVALCLLLALCTALQVAFPVAAYAASARSP